MKKEKFDELIYKSGLIAQGCWEKFDEYDQAALARLAELLVKECSYLADQAHYKATGGKTAGGYIRQHFGVEL